MSTTNPPDFKMTLGGVDFSSPEMAKRVVEIEVECVADGPDSFKVSLDDRDDYFTKSQKIKEGDSAKIELGYHREGTNEVVQGIITGVESFRREYRRQLFVVRGFDGMQALSRGRHRRSWEKIKDSDIAQILAGEAGLGCDADDSGIIHPYVAQNNVTNMDFLFERAKRIGFEVDVEGRNLRFKKPEVSGPVCDLIWDENNIGGAATGGGRLLKRCQFASSTMGVVDEVVVRGYDPKTRKEIIGRAKDVHGQTMGGNKTGPEYAAANNPATVIQVSNQPVASCEEAEKLAWSILNERAGNFMSGFGASEGDGRIKAGKTVKIDAIGTEMDGEYYVTRAVHKLRIGAGPGNGYLTEFEIRRSGR